jgi:hypothetical protein
MSRLARHTLAGGILLAMNSLSAIAQESPQEAALRAEIQPRAQQESTRRDEASKISETGAVDAVPQKSEVSISAEKDKSTAKISVHGNFSPGQLAAALSTPINQKDDATQFFTLDGPTEDVRLDLEWKRKSFGLGRLPQVDFLELTARRLQLCEKFKVPQDKPCSDVALEDAMKAVGKSSSDIAQVLNDFFSVKILGTNKTVSLLHAIPYRDFFLGGSVGRTERKFFTLSGTEKEDNRLSYSLSAAYRRVFESSWITARLTAQRKLKEKDKVRKCTVVPGSALESCKDLPLGEAALVDSVPLAFEYRFWRGHFAASPKLVYDFKRNVAAASLPIYFLPDSNGKLTGGIRLDWEEHKKPVAFVFVASPLGLD